MRTILILKRLITFLYYIIFIGFVGMFFSMIIRIFKGNIRDLKPKVFGEQLDYSSMNIVEIMMSIIIPVLLYYCFFQAVIYIKNSLKDLDSGNYFSELVIKNFKKTGILFIVCSLGEILGKMLFFLLLKSKFHFKIDSSIVLFFVMGLFFMFLSEVFDKARKTQQENDLTI